jgi:hypothetical protein
VCTSIYFSLGVFCVLKNMNERPLVMHEARLASVGELTADDRAPACYKLLRTTAKWSER